MPKVKVMLDLIDLPMHLRRDMAVARAVSGFGLYLGSIRAAESTDCTSWRVVVAMDDISRLSSGIAYVVGGLEYPVRVSSLTWTVGDVYTQDDFPKPPEKFSRPQTHSLEATQPSTPGASDTSDTSSEETYDLIDCSRRVLMELCQGLPQQSIPPEVCAILRDGSKLAKISIEVLQELVDAT